MGSQADKEKERLTSAFEWMVDELRDWRAAQRFEALTKQPLSKSSLERLTSGYGKKLVSHQAAEAEATVRAPERGEEFVGAPSLNRTAW